MNIGQLLKIISNGKKEGKITNQTKVTVMIPFEFDKSSSSPGCVQIVPSINACIAEYPEDQIPTEVHIVPSDREVKKVYKNQILING